MASSLAMRVNRGSNDATFERGMPAWWFHFPKDHPL
jgi:hypothetical protein